MSEPERETGTRAKRLEPAMENQELGVRLKAEKER
jgi:hypothetical protein